MLIRSTMLSCAAIALLLVGLVPGQAAGKPSGWGATVTLEPVLLAHGGFTARCNPRAAAQAGWGIERIEKLLRLTDQQRVLLNEMKVATVGAADLSAGICPLEIPKNSAERIDFFGRRLDVLRKATQIILPVFKSFYAALSTDQQLQLDVGPRRWRWR